MGGSEDSAWPVESDSEKYIAFRGKILGHPGEFLKGKTILGQGMGGGSGGGGGEFNKYINKTRIQIFTSEITISLLPLSCSINEWKSYDLLGQCDSRRSLILSSA